jgi:hypothetical protein
MSTIQPIYDPEGLFRIWHKREIYTGPQGTGQFVPKVDDLVVEIIDNVKVEYRVADLDIGNYLSTLVAIAPQADNSLGPSDIALGVGPGVPNQSYRIYIDKRTVPYSLAVDARLQVYGSGATYAKVFAGTDLSVAGRVISAVYDNGGNFMSENVSLELVATDALNNNTAVKVVAPCKTSANLVDGEVVTVVFYNSSDNVIAKQQLVVANTAFVRRSIAGAKTVVGLSLINPFLSTLNGTTLVYPRNLRPEAANFTGVVNYSDGTQLNLPVDGEKFSITGLDAYDTAVDGVSFPIVVKYELDVNEQAYGSVSGQDHVSATFTIITAAPNRDYEVRLFAYPKWLDEVHGYALTWWLYDASRTLGQDVSSLVDLAQDSAAFNPLGYGSKQTLKARINLSAVAGNYNDYTYVQEVDIKLMSPGTFRQDLSTPPNWYVTPVSGHTPMCGGGVFSTFQIISGLAKTFTVKGNYSVLGDWLAAYYTNMQPLVQSPDEPTAPVPTHFTLVINGATFQYPISQWNQNLSLSVACSNNDTIYISFQYAGQQMLELGAVGMPLYQRNGDGSYV